MKATLRSVRLPFMGYEIELKYRVGETEADWPITAVESLGGVLGPPTSHVDRYYNHPCRDFAVSGEAFRMRCEGGLNHLTYKGPKLGGTAKTREEFEIGFASDPASSNAMPLMLERLGFIPIAEVRKTRRQAQLRLDSRTFQIALDRVEGLGAFVEVETFADLPDDLAEAQRAVGDLAARLGLKPEHLEPRSYLRMVLQRTAGQPAVHPPPQRDRS